MNKRQQLFADEYLKDLNATRAAIRAGYSEKTARSMGAENLTKPDIKAYIEKATNSRTTALIAEREEVLQFLTRVMRREETESVVSSETTETTEFKDGHQQKKKKTKPVVIEIKSKLSDSNKAAEMLFKYYALSNDDNEESNTAIPINITFADHGAKHDDDKH